MINLFFTLLLLGLLTSGVVAVMIYSEICAPFRRGWNWFAEAIHMRILQSLTECTLCLGFWVSLVIQMIAFSGMDFINEIIFSFGAAFICWTANAFAQHLLWSTAFLKGDLK